MQFGKTLNYHYTESPYLRLPELLVAIGFVRHSNSFLAVNADELVSLSNVLVQFGVPKHLLVGLELVEFVLCRQRRCCCHPTKRTQVSAGTETISRTWNRNFKFQTKSFMIHDSLMGHNVVAAARSAGLVSRILAELTSLTTCLLPLSPQARSWIADSDSRTQKFLR